MSAASSSTPKMPWRLFFITWLALAGLLIVASLSRIATRGFFDPDDVMRLAQVRDLLAGQNWFDLTQYRLDPPHGTPMHWSRLVDAPLALVILLFDPLLGRHGAETAALVIVPMLTLGCVMGLAMRIAVQWFERDVAVMAAVCAALVPATLAQLNPLRIDHHGWQIACVMLAAASPLLLRQACHAAALAGFAFAAALAISIEPLPIAAGYGAILAFGWWQRPASDHRLAWFMASLAISLELLFLATRGPGALTPWCDAISPPHIAFFLIAASGIALASRYAPRSRTAVLAALGLSGIIAALVFARMAPVCIGAPFGAIDPLVMKLWYGNIAEGLPVWHQPPLLAVVSGVPVLLAAAALWQMRRRAEGEMHRFLTEYGLLFLAAALSGMIVWRSIAFAGGLGALGLGWLLHRVFLWAQYDRTAAQRGELPKRYLTLAGGIAALAAVMLWPGSDDSAGQVAQGASGAATKQDAAPGADKETNCQLPQSAALLNRLPPQTIFSPLDIAPDFLGATRHSVVASNHHRANLAIRDVLQAFMAPPDQARAIIARHKAGIVVVCLGIAEPGNYALFAPQGLMAQIKQGKAPAWLQPIDLGQSPQFKIYRVISQP